MERVPAEPLFLPTGRGERFCLYHAPARPCRAALLYVPPFGEEMNKSRRMAALAARALAADGVAVLQLDLHGCGDSDGDFADATWDGWLADLQDARTWLEDKHACRAGLWGLRLGALLALEHAEQAAVAPARLLFWQPVLSGASFLTQFLRLRVAADMLTGGGGASTDALRASLQAGEALDIGGYTLTGALASGLDAAEASRCAPPCPIDWIELTAAPERPLPPAAARTALQWQQQGRSVRTHTLACSSFWSSQEIETSAELVALTARLLRESA
ncbi:MAG: hydrolase 2, exosortase A system-associated [Gammaproteobacteria bacterium]